MPGGRTTILTFTICLAFSLFLGTRAASAAELSPKEEALQLFEESAARYQEGKFDEAAALLERAYSLHKEPVLLYNLARAYDGLAEYEKAIAAYEQYLAQSPDAKDRGALERRIETMKAELAKRREMEQQKKQRAAPAPAAPPPPPTPSVASSAGPWPWVVAGVGVAAVGVGTVFALQAGSKRSDADAEPVQRKAAETFRDAESLASTANVFLIAGAVATAGGVTWILLDRKGSQESSALSLRLSPNSVTLTGRL